MRYTPRISHLKKRLTLFAVCLGLWSFVALPGTGLAGTVTSNGTAFIDWSTLNITLGGASFDPAANFDPALGISSAFSGTQVQLNGDQSDFALSDYGSGGIINTSSGSSLSNLNGSNVMANALTGLLVSPNTANGLFASLGQLVNGPDVSGLPNNTPNQAQANYYDFGFLAPTAGQLVVTANYQLDNLLTSSDPKGFISSNVFAGLLLYGYDIDGNPMNDPLTTATAELLNSITGTGSVTSSSGLGLLTLTYNLTAGALYDLGGEVTATGSASAAPVPAPLLLLASGLLGLGVLKRARKTC